jgi:hypothetical protein
VGLKQTPAPSFFTGDVRAFIINLPLDGTGEHHSEQAQPVSEDQKSYVLPHMWTLDLGQMQQCGWTWIT